jgi:hypothetical protein
MAFLRRSPAPQALRVPIPRLSPDALVARRGDDAVVARRTGAIPHHPPERAGGTGLAEQRCTPLEDPFAQLRIVAV